MSKPLSKREFAKLMEAARQIALEDKAAGVADNAPAHSKKFQELIANLEYRLQQKAIGEYLNTFRGYKLDVRKLSGMFSDNKDY
jgi:uncharacterized membrane protein YccC